LRVSIALNELFGIPEDEVTVHRYACVGRGCLTRFFTREFDDLPHFAGKQVKERLARLAFLPANSTVCPVSRVNPQEPRLPDQWVQGE